MADKLDGQILYASDFNAKADKIDLDSKQDKFATVAGDGGAGEFIELKDYKYWDSDLNEFVGNDQTLLKLTNIYDGKNDFDAVNKRQLDEGLATKQNKVIEVESLTLNGVNFREAVFMDAPNDTTLKLMSGFSTDELVTLTGLKDGANSNDAVNVSQLNTKQNTLVSGTNIKSIKDDKTTPQSLLGSGSFSFKTINGETLLGSGNISISTGGTITIDNALSATSTNPVQNKVVNSALSAKQNTIKNTDVLTIAGLRASNNSMTLFNDSCVVSMTDDALIINFI